MVITRYKPDQATTAEGVKKTETACKNMELANNKYANIRDFYQSAYCYRMPLPHKC